MKKRGASFRRNCIALEHCWNLVKCVLSGVAIAWSAHAAPPELLSVRDVSVPLPLSGNGASVAPWLSSDGRFVVFSSSANNLAPDDSGRFGLDVFLFDRLSNSMVLASARLGGTGGGNDSSTFGTASAGGRYVVFQSDASDLVAGDTNGVSDIFMRDIVAGTTLLVSAAVDGGSGNGASSDAAVTPDGRYVAFVSEATNLVAGDTNGIPDVFVRDLLSNATILASAGALSNPFAFMSAPLISPDGRYVAFSSNARGLAPGIPANPAGEVYVRDLVADSTIWASTNAAALVSGILHVSGMPSYHPALSDDGRFVAFKAGTNGAVVPPAGGDLILLYDTVGGLTTVIHTNGFPGWTQNDDVFGPEMTPDGRFVAFVARQGSNQTAADVYLWDAQTGTNVLISANASGDAIASAVSRTPVVSPDGRFVAFLSDATGLVTNAVSNGFHIYLRDLQQATTRLVDAEMNGAASADAEGVVPALSADGRFVGFSSLDGNLVASDDNKARDIFVRDKAGGTTELISQRDPAIIPQSGNGASSLAAFSVSADGRRLAFVSYADDLVPNDTNGSPDVFVHDFAVGTNVLVSAGTNGVPALGGHSAGAGISADGRFVAFVSAATNLIAALALVGTSPQVYRRDLETQTNVLVSVSGKTPGNGDSSAPVISADGRYIAFVSSAGNLGGPSSGGVFLRDMLAGTNLYLPSSTVSSSIFPSMSADGRFVAYPAGTQVRVWDAWNGTNVYEISGAASVALSPTGQKLAYIAGSQLFIDDLVGQSNQFRFTAVRAFQSPSQFSRDGQFFAFVTASNALPQDDNGTNDVYLCDLRNGALTLVSASSNLRGSANGPSDWPVLSGDGSCLAYRSFATDIVPGGTHAPAVYLYSRLNGSNVLASVQVEPAADWTAWVAGPAVSADGTRVAFQSWSSGLDSGDLNRVNDVFSSAVSFAIDSDDDGIPDWWTAKYFGHPTGEAADESRAQDDADGDGLTNLEEYFLGTDPTSAGSALRIHITWKAGTSDVELSWPSATGRNYRVESKRELGDPTWLDLSGNMAGSGGPLTFGVPVASPTTYYRVVGNE